MGYKVESQTGKMKTEKKKEDIMENFKKQTDVLVATSVVEVGVNIPNASFIIIEEGKVWCCPTAPTGGRVIRG